MQCSWLWLAAVRLSSVQVGNRCVCLPCFLVGFADSLIGTDYNRTIISCNQEIGSTPSAGSMLRHHFSAFWLRLSLAPFRSSNFIPPTCGRKMSDRLSNMSGDTELLIDDFTSVVPETTSVIGSCPSWADAVPDAQVPPVPPELFSPSPGSNIPLTHVLAELMSSGAHFHPSPSGRWSTVGNTMWFNKELSVYFSCNTGYSPCEILEGFDAAGIYVDFITSVQFRASNRTWIVTFNNHRVKSVALGMEGIIISGCQIFLGDCERSVLLVKTYEEPSEIADTVLIGRLSAYGKVFSFRCVQWNSYGQDAP